MNADDAPPPATDDPIGLEEDSPRSSTPPFLVVGIGASAGGLPALEELFGDLPVDLDAAYVVVEHQAIGSPSMLGEPIGRQVTDGPIAVLDPERPG